MGSTISEASATVDVIGSLGAVAILETVAVGMGGGGSKGKSSAKTRVGLA